MKVYWIVESPHESIGKLMTGNSPPRLVKRSKKCWCVWDGGWRELCSAKCNVTQVSEIIGALHLEGSL